MKIKIPINPIEKKRTEAINKCYNKKTKVQKDACLGNLSSKSKKKK